MACEAVDQSVLAPDVGDDVGREGRALVMGAQAALVEDGCDLAVAAVVEKPGDLFANLAVDATKPRSSGR